MAEQVVLRPLSAGEIDAIEQQFDAGSLLARFK